MNERKRHKGQRSGVEMFDSSVAQSEMLGRCDEIYTLAQAIQGDIKRIETCSLLEGKRLRAGRGTRESIHALMDDIKEALMEQKLITEPEKAHQEGQKRGGIVKRIGKIAAWFLFYLVIMIVIIGAALFGEEPGHAAPRDILGSGYSAMIVLSGSMEREYPRGSMIMTKRVEADRLEIGDDITYLTEGGNRVVTHRIIGIYENYAEGERGFQTQGLENTQPDVEIVHSANVVGQVIYSNLFMGQAVTLVRNNIITIVGVLIILGIATFVIKRFILKVGT